MIGDLIQEKIRSMVVADLGIDAIYLTHSQGPVEVIVLKKEGQLTVPRGCVCDAAEPQYEHFPRYGVDKSQLKCLTLQVIDTRADQLVSKSVIKIWYSVLCTMTFASALKKVMLSIGSVVCRFSRITFQPW